MSIEIKKSWAGTTQIVGAADAWVTLSDTEQFSSAVDMVTEGYEGAHVIVELDHVGTTDEVKIKLYGSLDGINFDDTPIWEVQGDHDVDPQQLSFLIKDLAYFKIGLQVTGAVDAHKARVYSRPWRYQSV